MLCPPTCVDVAGEIGFARFEPTTAPTTAPGLACDLTDRSPSFSRFACEGHPGEDLLAVELVLERHHTTLVLRSEAAHLENKIILFHKNSLETGLFW